MRNGLSRESGWARGRCLDLEKKMREKIKDVEADNDELREKYQGIEVELEDLKKYIVQEHINGFNKGLRHVALFLNEVNTKDSCFDGNKDVVDGCRLDEEEMDSDQATVEAEAVNTDIVIEKEATITDEVKIDTK